MLLFYYMHTTILCICDVLRMGGWVVEVCAEARVIWSKNFGVPRASGRNHRRPNLGFKTNRKESERPHSERTWIRKRRSTVDALAGNAPKRSRTESLKAATEISTPLVGDVHARKENFLIEKRDVSKALAHEKGNLLDSEACGAAQRIHHLPIHP